MMNKAMARALKKGDAIDVAGCKRLGPYYVLEEFVDGKDYCDATREYWIWSIARALTEKQFKVDDEAENGEFFVVPENQILASAQADLYQRDGFECLFLR